MNSETASNSLRSGILMTNSTGPPNNIQSRMLQGQQTVVISRTGAPSVPRPSMIVNQSPVRLQQISQMRNAPLLLNSSTVGGGGLLRMNSAPGGRNVVINQPGLRPGTPGSQITVPLQTLQTLQPGQGIPTGQAGHLLVKTDNGQYQILRVSSSVTSNVSSSSLSSSSSSLGHVTGAPSSNIRPSIVNAVRPSSVPTSKASLASSGPMAGQMTPDTAKLKCKNFLATLLRLASEQPEAVARNVRNLIQGLIDGFVDPEVFTTKLQKELNSSPQPCLVPFLKRSLPYLQHSLGTGELSIDGVRAPNLVASRLPPRPSSNLVQQRPLLRNPIASQMSTYRPPNSGNVFHSSKSPLGDSPKISGKGNVFSSVPAGDEDINDVAAMGGVNIVEESQRMQGAPNMIGTTIRSCKDETFLQTGILTSRIAKICRDRGLEEPGPDVMALVSHATQDRLKTFLEKLSVITEHRMDIIKAENGNYEVSQDVKGQLKFLGDLDVLERRRHDEAERELLLRAAKSRTKTEDPEKEKLKAKAKELQRLEEEQLRHEKANNTALLAIGGPKHKKIKLDETVSGRISSLPLRPRIKRVQLRDLLFLMEQDKDLKRSRLLWKSYCS